MVFVQISGDSWYIFYVFRIGIDNSWKEIARKEAPRTGIFFQKPIYSGWNDLCLITIDEVIVMDVGKEIIVREYPLPSVSMLDGPGPKYFWMGNRLFCIAWKDTYYRAYNIYILDSDSGKWSLYHEMGPFDYMAACGRELNIWSVVFRFWINDQIIFQVSLCQDQIRNTWPPIINRLHFGYNVKTR